MRFWGKMKMFRDLHFCPHLLLNAPFRDMSTKSNNLSSHCFISLDAFSQWISNFGNGTFHARIFGNSAITPSRYHPNGTLDTSFGDGGLVTTDVFGHEDMAKDVVLQPDGKMIAAGDIRSNPLS